MHAGNESMHETMNESMNTSTDESMEGWGIAESINLSSNESLTGCMHESIDEAYKMYPVKMD